MLESCRDACCADTGKFSPTNTGISMMKGRIEWRFITRGSASRNRQAASLTIGLEHGSIRLDGLQAPRANSITLQQHLNLFSGEITGGWRNGYAALTCAQLGTYNAKRQGRRHWRGRSGPGRAWLSRYWGTRPLRSEER